jgi:tetratricopeptide (TPR) repeat protein/predicted transcriptional regulator
MGDSEVEERRELVAKRVEFVELFEDGQCLEPREFVDRLDSSRSTVTRALSELRDAGLLQKTTTGYTATAAARMAVAEYRRYEATMASILRAGDLLEPISTDSLPSMDFLVGSKHQPVTDDAPFRPLETVADRVRGAEAIQAYLPTLVTPYLLRLLAERASVDQTTTEVVFDEGLFREVRGQYPELLGHLAASDDSTVWTATDREYAVFLATHADHTTCSMVVYEDSATVLGALHNDEPDAVDWGQSVFAGIRDGGTEVTDQLKDATGVGKLGSDGGSVPAVSKGLGDERVGAGRPQELPMDLTRAGFVEVTHPDSRGEDTPPPSVTWRTEFTLGDVRAGHTAARYTADGDQFDTQLLEDLLAGENRVLIGPPGAGKSVVCKRVACEWADRGYGRVLYRESGDGSTFQDPAVLEAHLRRHDGHTLVVVEDVLRPAANEVLATMRRIGSREDVSFLLDSRREEWSERHSSTIDPRLETYRRTALETVSAPPFDEADCHRFVQRYGELVEDDVPVTGSELWDWLDAADLSGQVHGGPLLAAHLLSRAAGVEDMDSRTELEADARRVYELVADEGGTYDSEVAVLASLLTVAGVPVTDSYLYALADGSEDYAAVEEAVRKVQGELVFDGPDNVYRTRHDRWAVAFLDQFLDAVPTARARDTFGRCVTRFLAVADDADKRERIQRATDGPTPYINRVEADPGGWADAVVERLFDVGRAHAFLEPLYGTTEGETIRLPDACGDRTRSEQAFWRGSMAARQGNFDRAEREYEHLLVEDGRDDFPQDDANYLRLLGTRGKATVAMRKGESERALDQHGKALELATELENHRFGASIRREMAGVHYSMDAYTEARDQLERCRELATDHGLDDLAASADAGLGLIDLLDGEVQSARRTLESAVDDLDATDDEQTRINAHGNLGTVLHRQNAVDRAETEYRRAIDLAREHGLFALEANYLLSLASLRLYCGSPDEAMEYATTAEDLIRDAELPWHHGNLHNTLAAIAAARGNVATATEHAETTCEIIADEGRPAMRSEAHRLLGRLALRDGDLDTAGDELGTALEVAEQTSDPKPLADCRRLLARLALERGDLDQASEMADEALDRYIEWEFPRDVAACQQILGAVAFERDAIDTARERIQSGLETVPENAAPRVRTRLRETAARIDDVEPN